MPRHWLRSLLLLPLAAWLTSCGSPQRVAAPNAPRPGQPASLNRQAEDARQAKARAQAERQRDQERCLRERPELEALMTGLREAEIRLARVKEESYVPLPAPEPWDDTRESRYRLEDREADWQRHLEAQAAWASREQKHRDLWLANHGQRLQLAQERLDQQARELRARRSELFTGPGSIEFHPDVAHRILHC